MIGTTLGPYRIESQAGRGGMGIVYRATDTRLQRPVAIKLLPADAIADPDRKARFVREAQAASALNHSNIVTIYQIGTEGSTDFIAMEFVVGRSLDQVIHGRPLALDEARRHAIAIASALGAAHEIGIVHRDLKPANVMVTEKGHLKLLDFGVAKLTERTSDSDSSPTMTSAPDTSIGMVVGTVAYMSPEQARGDKVDARSDIYSFGVVLHEMLTGVRPANDANIDVLLTVPRDLRRIVSRCLQPDASRRFQMIDDVRIALEDADAAPDAIRAPAKKSRSRMALWAVLPAVVAAAGVVAFVLWPRPAADARGPTLTRLTMDAGLTTDQALSADGKFIAYASDRSGDGNLDIWVRQVAGGEPARLTTDAADDHDPAFSPDGSTIAFRSERAGGGIYVVSTLGGDARRIFDHGRRPRWSPDGTKIACWAGVDTAFLMNKADAPRIYVLPASGGEPQRLFSDFAVAWAPIWSADGRSLLFPGSREPAAPTDWWAAPLDSDSPHATGAFSRMRTGGLSPSPETAFLPEAWTSDGQVLFSARLGDSTNLWQIHVPDRGPSDGPPRRLTTGTGLEIHPSAAPGATLVFSAVTRNTDLWSLPTDTLRGVVTGPMQRLTQDPANDAYPALSPDGKNLVFVSNRSRGYDLWRRDMASGKDEIIAANVTFPQLPIVTKDGSRVVYSPDGKGTRWATLPLSAIARDRSSTPQSICEDCNPLWDVSADGRWALYAKGGDDDIGVREIATGRTSPFMKTPGEIIGRFRISPDDRWVTFTHRSGGEIRVVVAPFRPGAFVGPNAWIPMTANDTIAFTPTWSPDSGAIYYVSDRDGDFCIWVQRIDRASGRPAGDARAVWHFHEAHQSMASIQLPFRGLAVAGDRIVTTLIESTGNIWMATPPGR